MADGIDWGVHRGSCRVFYAERRCTCGATVASDPMTAPVPDPRFRDRFVEAMRLCSGDHEEWADTLMPLIEIEVEARVQAAANQRAAEAVRSAFREVAREYYRAPRADVHDWLWEEGDTRAAALASPAPAPHAEAGS